MKPRAPKESPFGIYLEVRPVTYVLGPESLSGPSLFSEDEVAEFFETYTPEEIFAAVDDHVERVLARPESFRSMTLASLCDAKTPEQQEFVLDLIEHAANSKEAKEHRNQICCLRYHRWKTLAEGFLRKEQDRERKRHDISRVIIRQSSPVKRSFDLHGLERSGTKGEFRRARFGFELDLSDGDPDSHDRPMVACGQLIHDAFIFKRKKKA